MHVLGLVVTGRLRRDVADRADAFTVGILGGRLIRLVAGEIRDGFG